MTRYHYEATRGALKESRILAALASGPMTARQIAESLHIHLSGVSIYTRRMRAAPPRIFIAGFVSSGRGREAPMYALGSAPDAVFDPTRKPKMAIDRRTARRAQTLAALKATPMTAADMGAHLKMTAKNALVYIGELRDSKKAYIKEWRHPGRRGDLAPVYALGSKLDAPKPRQTRADRYAADKKDKEKYMRLLADRRKLHMLARATKTPQTPFSALFIGVRVPVMNAEG